MEKYVLPREIVDRLLRAGNARDIDAYCALYAHDAVLFKLNTAQELARGIDAIRARYTERFKNSQLHCEIKSRIELGDFVVDHERVSGLEDEPLDIIAILEVRDSLIRSVRFIWP
jgi:hypothetical protein